LQSWYIVLQTDREVRRKESFVKGVPVVAF